jgi:aminoacyl tRNA synthase complex-interacting multifunctional protein 1
MQSPQYYAHPSLTRYFDHIQSHPAIRKSVSTLASGFPLISFDLAGAPKSERKSQPSKKKEKAVNQAGANVPQPSSAVKDEARTPVVPSDNRTTEVAGGKTQKKEKKKPSNESGKAGGKAAAAVEDAGDPVPSMIDLRVGNIVDGKLFVFTWCPLH